MNIKLEEWIIEADITSMQLAMEEGLLTSEELVSIYLERIEIYNPEINAVLEINPDALQIAKQLDQERRERGSRGLLHGIPILVKDNVDTGDRMHTSAGSVVLADSFAARDSFVAAKLRESGAVLLGKTNMTEWSNFMSSTMPAGYSSRGGEVRSPYEPGEIFVSGSSSGSGAAVAAGFAAAAIGTETAGSIIGPACQSFLVGIKPTVGLVSRAGIIPISVSQDTAGPLARSVRDAAILLGALTGMDERDAATNASHGQTHEDYTPFLDASSLQQARIGVPRHYYKHLDKERLAIMEAAIESMKQQGAAIIDPIDIYVEEQAWNNDVICYEFKQGLNRYLSQTADSVPVHSLHELIAYHEAHTEIAARHGQDTLIRSQASTMTEEEYRQKKAEYSKAAMERGIDYVLEQHQLDALLLPGDIDGMYIAARLGYPLVCVPAGYSEQGSIDSDGDSTKGPFAVVFSGKAFSEPVLIKLAYAFEQATKHRFPPPNPFGLRSIIRKW
ncbi:amidase family protein [Paenibacillus sp. HB172176]|uniref:amidase family protein n=1 Tax=Paenibacillus sp. HB172176 TaxID=2493690 RepID=UPI00143C453B|nr:amidase family protein [Paenibacillus sp. HB172176]